MKDGVKLLIKALNAGEKSVSRENIEIAVITEKEFKKISGTDIDKFEKDKRV